MAEQLLTAFPATERAYRDAIDSRPVDGPSFARPISRCELAHCRGSCCAAGVSVNQETMVVLRRLAAEERDFFESVGVYLPDDVIARPPEGAVEGYSRTALAPRQFHGLIEGFPEHFPDAACVFLAGDGRCSLQMLSAARGHHPWYFKPFPCWLHPIIVGETALTVPDEETDTLREEGGFTTATFCGRTDRCGRPAGEVLTEELQFLGAIIGRDLIAELASADAGGSSGAPIPPTPA